jgi:Holliday junction resolvase
MAMTPEGRVKKKLKEILDAYGVYHFPPATGGYGKSGVPDIVGCYRGCFFGIECKAGKGKTTALQDMQLQAIRDAGGIAMVVNEHNLHEVHTILQSVKDKD